MPVGLDDAGLEQGRVDHLAFTCHLPVPECGTDPHGEQDSGRDVGHRHTGLDGRPARRFAGHAHDPGHGLGHEIVARPPAVGAGSSETAHGAIDNDRIELSRIFVADAETFENTGTEVLHDDIRRCDEASGYGDALGLLEVEGQAALVAVDNHVGCRDPIDPVGIVGVVGRVLLEGDTFDLDDVGPHVGEHHRACWTRHDVGEIDHPDAVERPVAGFHDQRPLNCGAVFAAKADRPMA